MSIGAVVNAAWDLIAKRAQKPLWKLLVDMDPEQIVELIDFRYLSDALTEKEALQILYAAHSSKPEREKELWAGGYPAYTTRPGWLGYNDEKLEDLAIKAMSEGFTQIKLKVGAGLADDRRRLTKARHFCGCDFRIAIDANQRWDVGTAIEWIQALAEFRIALVEEPTSPDDIFGHASIAAAISPIPVASGEHMANRVVAKQFLQAGALQILQIDSARVAGVNENIAMLLLAKKFGVSACPHAGGVGLCEAVQQLSMFDFTSISQTTQGSYIEHVDHRHEHYVEPVNLQAGNYMPPQRAGNSQEMLVDSREESTFPTGLAWQELREGKY